MSDNPKTDLRGVIQQYLENELDQDEDIDKTCSKDCRLSYLRDNGSL